MTELWSDYISQEPEMIESVDLDYNVLVTTFEDKSQQFALKSATPNQSWRMLWGTISEDDINNIFAFYAARSGRFESFYWDHPYEITTLSAAGGGQNHVHVTKTMKTLQGDTILIAGTSYSVLATTATITGDSDITFVEGGASKDTITDVGDGFETAGFVAGQSITVTESANNNGTYTLFGVAAGTLTLIATDDLVDEGSTSATIAAKPIDDANNIINLTASCSEANAAAVQLRYTVRFANPLTIDTIKSWVYKLGLRFERSI